MLDKMNSYSALCLTKWPDVNKRTWKEPQTIFIIIIALPLRQPFTYLGRCKGSSSILLSPKCNLLKKKSTVVVQTFRSWIVYDFAIGCVMSKVRHKVFNCTWNRSTFTILLMSHYQHLTWKTADQSIKGIC